MVTLANEMGISPESFIKRGLDNEDLRNTGDDVIWSVEDLEKPYLTETPKKQKEYIEEVNTGNDFRYLLALYHLAKISSKYTFFGYVKNDGIKVDKNCLFVKVKNRNIKISFPLRKDMVGKFSPDSPTWRKPGNKIISPLIFGEKIDTPVNGCWKFHVTATPFSAKKVIKHVLPYLHRYNIDYKIMPDIGVMRIFYLNERFGHVSQYGKFITIYPQTRQVSQRIANDLDGILSNRGFQGGGIVIPSHDENDPKCFTEKDFVTCNGDYSVGTSGGLFARYVFDYNANDGRGVLDEWEQRRIPVILESLLEESAEYMPHSLTYCGISFGGEDFVKNIRILGLVNYLRSQRQRYDQFLLKPIPEETER
jgi:hypothetical protein